MRIHDVAGDRIGAGREQVAEALADQGVRVLGTEHGLVGG